MKIPADQTARSTALDPSQSFIVQAPAGSGKTTLLVQRVLILLATQCEHPENAVAITFTRKAAEEMKARIMAALHAAHQGDQHHPHYALALRVLEKDRTQGWNLITQSHRLTILTFDALCARLMQRMPVLSQLGHRTKISTEPTQLYEQAVHELFDELRTTDAPALCCLLSHLDLNSARLARLLNHLLSVREQWLPYLSTYQNKETEFKTKLEASLAAVSLDLMATLSTTIPPHTASQLMQCLQFAYQQGYSKAPLNVPLCALPPVDQAQRIHWLNLANLLLTKKGQWRKTFNKTVGFPAVSTASSEDKLQFQTMKETIQAIALAFRENPSLQRLWHSLQQSPEPRYTESQWKILRALIELLPRAVAQLHFVFLKQNQLDFTEVSQRALLALGKESEPTQLALYLDHTIMHLLVDEFQDTSFVQFRLLKQLTAGWQPGDTRTLFLVGDPMQSIYRFRQAEVALFLQVQQHGLGSVLLTPLSLTANFRSQASLVDWFNTTLAPLFPTLADQAIGAIPYCPSSSQGQEEVGAGVQFHPVLTECTAHEFIDPTAQKTLTLISQYRQRYPTHQIAVLVRTRTHARPILTALNQAALPYVAIDMDYLVQHPLIQDLLTLTRALSHLADRIAWLALLRAPWCGLSLQDLHTLCADEKDTCLWALMQDPTRLARLTPRGQQQLNAVNLVLRSALQQRFRVPLAHWIEDTWLALQGPACLESPHELTVAKAFWECLERCETTPYAFLTQLEHTLSHAFVPIEPRTDAYIQVMTIHKAKGLEFDCVIIPGLERQAAYDRAPLLHWLERLNQAGQPQLLLAPIHHHTTSEDPIFDYLKYIHQCKKEQETLRLLYVAATRAKHQLHWIAQVKQEEDGTVAPPANRSLLKLLGPHLATECRSANNTPQQTVPSIEEKTSPSALKRRIMSPFPRNPLLNRAQIGQKPVKNTIHVADSHIKQPAIIGTVIHRLLQQLAEHPPIQDHCPSWLDCALIRHQLRQEGCPEDTLHQAIAAVKAAVAQTLADPRGRWILSPHWQAQSEWSLSYYDRRLYTCVIDRSFIAEGIRWIIDFKTTPLGENTPTDFLAAQQALHQQQLHNYAEIAHKIDSSYPIHCALYFPLSGLWHSWHYSTRGAIPI